MSSCRVKSEGVKNLVEKPGLQAMGESERVLVKNAGSSYPVTQFHFTLFAKRLWITLERWPLTRENYKYSKNLATSERLVSGESGH